MTQTKFTPGPWQYRPHELDDWGTVRGPNGSDGYSAFICQAKDMRYMEDDYLNKCRSSKTDPWEANARLIAAAPELYEALEMVRDADEDCKADGFPTMPATARAKIDRALAKARGES